MGISVSAGTAVILVGVFLMLGVIVPGMLNAHDRVTTATDRMDERTLDQKQTSVQIERAEIDNGTLEVEVENTGTTSLHLSKTSVLVNNEYVVPTNSTITETNDNETDLWLPDETTVLEIDPADHSEGLEEFADVKVVTQFGNADRTDVEGDA